VGQDGRGNTASGAAGGRWPSALWVSNGDAARGAEPVRDG
jgi:hypothetical protein